MSEMVEGPPIDHQSEVTYTFELVLKSVNLDDLECYALCHIIRMSCGIHLANLSGNRLTETAANM